MVMLVPAEARRQAALLLKQRKLAAATVQTTVPARYGLWLHDARSDFSWTANHFLEMQEVLDEVTAGTSRRVLFSIPIRHGKSEHNTISYAAYRLERNPKTRIVVASYNQRQANKFSREIRKLARRRGVALSNERDAAEEWETAAGGGVRAVGSGGGLASVNADLIIIDDPIGARADAESQAKRDEVWDWITNDILARCEPHTAVLFTMSRWHTDDPIGRLLADKAMLPDWEVVDLPGEAEENDPLGREVGEPLWPELRDKAWMQQKRRELNEYGFASLIQGRPRPRQGGMFQWDWWTIVPAVPSTGRMVRYWDMAGTQPKGRKSDPDYTAGALVCRLQDQRSMIVNVKRFRLSVAARDAEMLKVCRDDITRYRGRVLWWIEAEAGIDGERRTTALVRRLQNAGMVVHTEHPTGNKVFRAEPLASKAEVGNVVLGPDDTLLPWHDDFRLEANDFPNGGHDDQIDAAGGADGKLEEAIAEVGFSSVSM